jgi:hypothetical protein
MVMEDFNKREFQEIVLATAELYSTVKKIEVSPVMLKLFFSSLKQYTIEQVSYGFEQHLSDSVDGKFFPKPANIIKHLQTGEISAEDKAELAWAQVMREIRVTGSYGSLKLDDRQAMAAVKSLGSWKQLCASTVDEMTWKKKEFISMYETYEKTPLEMLPSSLPGRIALVEHKKEQSAAMQNILSGIDKHRATLINKGINT